MGNTVSLQEVSSPAPRVLRFGEIEMSFEQCGDRSLLLAAKSSVLIEKLWAAFVKSGATILSLDVFDTFLIRNWKPEARRWYEVSEQVAELASVTAWDAYVARNMATVSSYRTRKAVGGCREGHIDDILRMQIRMLNADRLTVERLKQIEIDYEIANLSPNPLLMELARRVQAQGGRVVLVTDMYLDAKSVWKIVEGVCGDDAPVDDIVSSADTVVSKRSGLVFEHVEDVMSAAPDAFFHIGDSRIGDFVMPVRRGWSAIHLPIPAAERTSRDQALAEFLTDLSAQGHDPSAWAKV